MPIDFPNNPTSGQTYSYGSQQWQYNGVAWDKIITGVAGATGATGATGAQGAAGQSSNYYNYKVHTTTQTPPTGNGEIRYNNASQIGATLLYVDHLDDTGNDIDVFLSLLKQNDNLIIQDAADSNNYQTWRITSAPTVILNDYTTIPVTGVTSAGTGTTNFSNNLGVLFIVFSSPIATEYVQSIRGLTGAVGVTNGSGIGLSVSGQTMTFSNTGVLSFNGLTGAVTGVGSFNGATGTVVGVNSIRGLTGAVGITNGSGIGLSVSGQTMTFSNTGVLSIDGGTGAITNVARTNITNTFSANQTISRANAAFTIQDTSSLNEINLLSEFNQIYFYNDLSGGEVYFQPTIPTASTITVTLPSSNTTLAGLATTQIFTETNTFNALTNFPGGISAAGATFSSLARFNAGISAAGATLSVNTIIPSGSTLTVNGNFVANGNVNLGDATTDSINVAGLLSATSGLSAAGGATFAGTVASDTGYRITSNAINAQTGTTYAFLTTDNGKIVTFNNASTTTVTIPTGLPVGFNCTAIQLGAGQVGFTAASGVTMNAYASGFKVSGQHGAAAVISYSTNIFNLSGTLSV
jgi:hypothetical protein